MKNNYIQGMKAGIPVILGFIPVGIAFGVMARQANFTILQTCLTSLTVFAGASQMLAVSMTLEGATILAIILATFILNLRHLIMSTVVMNKMEGRTSLKLIAAFGVTDESFAIFSETSKEKSNISYFFGLITVTYLSWNLGTFFGAVVSDFLPEIITNSFDIALYALFISLLIPNLHGNFRLFILVIITALTNTLLSLFIDTWWAIITSTLLCAFIGVYFVNDKEGQ